MTQRLWVWAEVLNRSLRKELTEEKQKRRRGPTESVNWRAAGGRSKEEPDK